MAYAAGHYESLAQIMSIRRERKYMLIRYLNAGYSLEDAKRKSIVVATASTNEYMSPTDKRDLLSLEGGLHYLTQTRADSAAKMKTKFAPRKGFGRREEAVSSLMTAWRIPTPLDYSREAALRGKNPPARPRPGSSKGKIGKTRVIGAKRTLLGLRNLFRELRNLDPKGKGVGKGQRKAVSAAIKAAVTDNGG